MKSFSAFIFAACLCLVVCVWYCVYGSKGVQPATAGAGACYRTVCIEGYKYVVWTCGGGIAQVMEGGYGGAYPARCGDK